MSASWVDDTWLALDTETTGINPWSDRIVSIACIEVHPDGTVGDEYSTIVDPGVEIPDEAAAIHGITNERAYREGVPPYLALEEVARRIFAHGHRPVVMFNAPYDWPICLSEAERHGVEFPFCAPVLDPFLVDRMVDRYRKGSRKLLAVAKHYQVDLPEEQAHGAYADALAAAQVMRAILARNPDLADMPLASAYLRQVRGHEHWRIGFIDFKRRQGNPVDVPPGWPIPADVAGGRGLPVLEEPSAVGAGGSATGEGTAASAAAVPDPEHQPAA